MSEHDDRYARGDLPRTTGEFRAAPDISASTAEFRAFVAGRDPADGQQESGGTWPEQPWAGQAPTRGSRRTMTLLAAAIAVVVVIVVIIVAVG
jgi:hypothetical protein